MRDRPVAADRTAEHAEWGRADLESLADRTLLALRPWGTPGHARFDLPGPASRAGSDSDGLEAFARSFLAAGFRLSVSIDDPDDHAGWYASGLISGTDPESRECWPSLVEVPQARVEAAAISIALHESRGWIWDRLDPAAQQRIVDWLAPSGSVPYPDNNWRWFCNVTQAFLRSAGGPHDQQRIDDNIAIMDGWYLGEVDGRGGWYNDGADGTIDWYNGWVMQLFSLWYCRMSAGLPGIGELQDRFRGRLRDYLDQLRLLWGGDGAPLFQGRSLTYRYAAVAAPWAGAIFDASPMPAGQLRRLCLGGIRYFVERGAFTPDGLLSLGWLGRHDGMRQSYSGPGSPYWSSLGLAGLVIGPQDPFWSAPSEPLPIESDDVAAALPKPGWLVSGSKADGIVRLINHGVDHGGEDEDPLYNRIAYSTATAPLETQDGAEIADNQVVLVDPSGAVTRRVGFRRLGSAAAAGSAWGPIRCWSAIRGAIEVRAVRLQLDDHDHHDFRLLISGFAIPQQPVTGARTGLRSQMRPMLGDGRCVAISHRGSNPFGAELLINQVEFRDPRADTWYVVGISLTDGDEASEVPNAQVRRDGALEIFWPDGEVQRIPEP